MCIDQSLKTNLTYDVVLKFEPITLKLGGKNKKHDRLAGHLILFVTF